MATPPTFTDGDVLYASQMNAVGLWLVKTQTIGTAVSSVNVTSAFSSDYDNYLVLVNGCTSSAGGPLKIRLGTRSTGYKWQLVYGGYNNTPSCLGSASDTHMKYVQGLAAGQKFDVSIPVFAPNLAQYTRVGPCNYVDAGAGGSMFGFDDSTTAYTSIEIFPDTGTFTGGTVRVFGLRN